jgi:acyl-homoserine-lactone acylase
MKLRCLAWLVAVAAPLACLPVRAQTAVDHARWAAEAGRVTIVSDDWGIAHVHGQTDADAVFGMIYAQCEDDFNRVETNYLVSLGRLAEAAGPGGGEAKIWQDLRQRLFLDPAELQRDYAHSPPWLQALMDAWADGLNFYLASHPETHPRVITHFEPWMALSFTEGSIGGDIERVNLDKLRAHYDHSQPAAATTAQLEPATHLARLGTTDGDLGGSNGIAIAPSNTVDHHALLLINPHTSFYFRSELQMSSDQGLDAYGAVTWGQFFIYQGFNSRAGWMHTSSNVDAIDEFVDTIVPAKGTAGPTPEYAYRYGSGTRPFTHRAITLRYKTPDGMRERTIVAYFDHRGPVIRDEDGKWVSIELMNRPIPALEQSYLRTKATTYAEYKKTMELFANSSNNTIFADAGGDIAYWHGNYIPRRDNRFDYTQPVDGSNPDTDWKGLLTLDQVPHLLNPASGFLFNVNNAPWWGAGVSSLKKSDFPVYVEQGGETARGIHAIRLLEQPDGMGKKGFTLNGLLTSAFDSYLPWFARTVPVLLQAYDSLPESDPQKAALHDPIAALRGWNYRWDYDSIPTTLAVYWGEAVGLPVARQARQQKVLWEDYVATQIPPATMLDALTKATAKLTADFGTWQKPWSEINRFQRLNDNIAPSFDDAGPSIPVPFTSSAWGSLASFAARAYPNTKKRYGSSGNSFVAVVEFGPRVHARAVTAGGESGHPGSPHFDDEATRYATGNLREVYFYPDQLSGHTERIYHPGQ